ncbi:KamA family radical SAM protein [Paenibacillus thiaminolyticus]|uniref:KamA family radical SAM protein n=1 Tax=Paenibacillus thiaminolyticus TaxID=49283 RepID=A0AAP9J1K7_PANTH|nr:KamA family radical SAM protein [Paenibacillus thiaminolyticus]MCY9536808.1 KamA family radical SAM protein [Paenibacillus thiaminolyticus]MCY9603976.1 KamA family radical SAM protein [Paenibacillus thiaminolyticus]MCY9609198.1 KamA family radical SAM protein [Paenibacillus thiaminolyticus]MCY9612284.1 KamA family radical SAM protein [Paenibacillus thiaminolyticus]MCY9621728.1 KamA family radical SAM protein [Paenibacillus thiaminolyticus]
MPMPKYVTDIEKITQIPETERKRLKQITEKFVFRVNDYYLNLIDWNDPDDPIRKLVIPNTGELQEYGRWDASDEDTNYVVPGCQHKYGTTALLIVSEVCGAYCRYCFRKRLFRNDVKEAMSDVNPGLAYIADHPEINNVLLTGGDSLILATPKLRMILERLRAIPHVQIIRLGSKMPVFNPMRIYEDDALLETIREFSSADKRIYVMAHINHPREITAEAKRGFEALHQAGAIVVNQTPVLRGINDNADVLGELLDKLSWAGVTPYYFFINRPVAGNREFVLPLKDVYRVVEEAKAKTSGLGKRVRLSMSHTSGKIEILAIEDGKAYLKYHQSRDNQYGRFMVLDCPDDAAWFDDLPGNEQFWTPPVKKTEDVVSVNALPDMPQRRTKRDA